MVNKCVKYKKTHEKARRIMYGENYINTISTCYRSLSDESNKDTHFKVAPEVSLIYVCSLMGDKILLKNCLI